MNKVTREEWLNNADELFDSAEEYISFTENDIEKPTFKVTISESKYRSGVTVSGLSDGESLTLIHMMAMHGMYVTLEAEEGDASGNN